MYYIYIFITIYIIYIYIILYYTYLNTCNTKHPEIRPPLQKKRYVQLGQQLHSISLPFLGAQFLQDFWKLVHMCCLETQAMTSDVKRLQNEFWWQIGTKKLRQKNMNKLILNSKIRLNLSTIQWTIHWKLDGAWYQATWGTCPLEALALKSPSTAWTNEDRKTHEKVHVKQQKVDYRMK